MTKLLRISDYLLISASIAGELFEDVRLAGDIVPKIMEVRYGFVPPNFKRNSYLSSVSKLLSTGEINRKINSKGEPYLELTPTGNDKFKRKFPILSLQNKTWDGNFMIVMFDISQKENRLRGRLRSKLKELGFGMLQESVWISPYHFEEDFREFVKSSGMEKYVYVLSAKVSETPDYKKLVNKIWKLDDLNMQYRALLDEIESEDISLKKIWEEYFAISIKDPMLPKSLLPDDWCRELVVNKLKDFTKTTQLRVN